MFPQRGWCQKIFALQHLRLKGIAKYFSSFIDTVGHNIWWENSRNGSFGPKNDPKTQIWPFLRIWISGYLETQEDPVRNNACT